MLPGNDAAWHMSLPCVSQALTTLHTTCSHLLAFGGVSEPAKETPPQREVNEPSSTLICFTLPSGRSFVK